jgi:hypothetical protein
MQIEDGKIMIVSSLPSPFSLSDVFLFQKWNWRKHTHSQSHRMTNSTFFNHPTSLLQASLVQHPTSHLATALQHPHHHSSFLEEVSLYSEEAVHHQEAVTWRFQVHPVPFNLNSTKEASLFQEEDTLLQEVSACKPGLPREAYFLILTLL